MDKTQSLAAQLKKYLWDNDLTLAGLGKLLGYSAVYMHQIVTLKRGINEKMEYRINKLLFENTSVYTHTQHKKKK